MGDLICWYFVDLLILCSALWRKLFWIQSFLPTWLDFFTKAKETSLPYNLPISGGIWDVLYIRGWKGWQHLFVEIFITHFFFWNVGNWLVRKESRIDGELLRYSFRAFFTLLAQGQLTIFNHLRASFTGDWYRDTAQSRLSVPFPKLAPPNSLISSVTA